MMMAGETSWTWMGDEGKMHKQHRHGSVLSLGHEEAIVVGFNSQDSAVEIYSGGKWTLMARHPVDRLHFPALVAKSRWQIYCLGGYGSSGPVGQVTRFDRALNKWTNVGDIPNIPNGHGDLVLIMA